MVRFLYKPKNKNMSDQNNTNPRQALAEAIRQSTNILVTVTNNPTVDQLAACLGLTIWLNKLDKHATAVFSGEVPSTLEFLEPEATLEKDTDSLRDFIIALDKSKADKLRYKVEENVVKIFITPYRTSLSADDLEYSQGDYNVDMVIALGVHEQADLDTAVVSHGRILHDATVAAITVGERSSELGSVSWHVNSASGLSELVAELGTDLGANELDSQIATALLTGVVSETERFSNDKTTPQVMSISAQLMAAGANQQLVAAKLQEPAPQPVVAAEPQEPESSEPTPTDESPESEEKPKEDDGTLTIDHEGDEEVVKPIFDETSTDTASSEASEPQEAVDETAVPAETPEAEVESPDESADGDDTESRLATDPPAFGGTLTANTQSEDVTTEPSSDPLSGSSESDNRPLLSHDNNGATDAEPGNDTDTNEVADDSTAQPAETAQTSDEQGMQPAPPDWMPPQPWMGSSNDQSEPVTPPEPETPVTDTEQPQDVSDQPSEPAVAEDQSQTPPSSDTLADLERQVNSDHIESTPTEDAQSDDGSNTEIDNARNEVMRAINSGPDAAPEPVEALNAQPIDLSPKDDSVADQASSMAFDPVAFEASDYEAPATDQAQQPASAEAPTQPPVDVDTPVEQPFTMPLPGTPLTPPPANPVPPTSNTNSPSAPPPVPPPMTGFPPQQ